MRSPVLRRRSESGVKAWWAHFEDNTFLRCTETAVLVVGNANSVFLRLALGFFGSSLSLGENNSLSHVDLTVDAEGSVLCLELNRGMGSLSTLAAVGLANLVELCVGNSRQ